MNNNEKIIIKQLINKFSKSDITLKKENIKFLNNLKKEKNSLFCNTEIFKNIINIFMQKNVNLYFEEGYQIADLLYKNNVSYIIEEDDLKNFYNIYEIVLTLIKNNSELSFYHNSTNKNYNYIKKINQIYHSFENKRLITNLLISNLINIKNEKELTKLTYIKDYIIKSKKYYNDEFNYSTNLYSFINRINGLSFDYINHSSNAEKIIDEYLNYDKKQAGIYDIDEEKIQEIEKTTNNLFDEFKKIQEYVNTKEVNLSTIKNEINDLLNDINSYKSKRYKIIKTPSFENTNPLFLTVKKYNQNFKIITTTTHWFNKEVIDLFGYEFIANSSELQQKYIEEFYNRNKINLYKKIIDINPEFWMYDELFQTHFEYLFENFSPEIIASKFVAREMQSFIYGLGKNKLLSLLKKIYEINPNFEIKYFIGKFIDSNFLNYINLEELANNNYDIQYTIYYFIDYDQIDKLKKILLTDSKFYEKFSQDNAYKYIKDYAEKEFLPLAIKNLSENEIIQLYEKEINSMIIDSLYYLKYWHDDPEITNNMFEFIDFYKSLSFEEKEELFEINLNDKEEAKKTMKRLGKNYQKKIEENIKRIKFVRCN